MIFTSMTHFSEKAAAEIAAVKPEGYEFFFAWLDEELEVTFYIPGSWGREGYTKKVVTLPGKNFTQLPVPPWVAVGEDDSHAYITTKLLLASEKEELLRDFLDGIMP